MVLTSVLNELKDAPNRAEFKVVAYIDQVYECQRADFVEQVNKQADAAIAFTPEWRECILSQGLTLPCHVLPHGINPQTYFPVPKPLARRFYGLPESDFLVLNLNRNQPRKRWDTCLQAFAEVVRRLPDAPIKLVVGTDLKGAWDLHEVYKRELRKRGVPVELGLARLVVPGHAQMLTDEETNVLYNIADVGINTCDGEGFGLCNFEQAAVGIPQIVPRLGGFLHIFDPSIAAMVDPVLSFYVDSSRDGVGGEARLSRSDDYADAIVAYYNDRELLARHGTCGRAAILSRFGWDKIADRFLGIVRAVAPPVVPQAPQLHATPLPQASPLSTSIAVDDVMRMLGDRSSLEPAPRSVALAPSEAAQAAPAEAAQAAPSEAAQAAPSEAAQAAPSEAAQAAPSEAAQAAPPPPPDVAPTMVGPLSVIPETENNKKKGAARRRGHGSDQRQRNLADLIKLRKRLETLLGNLDAEGDDDDDSSVEGTGDEGAA
jgi:glycosyltransferase involved in cell wall biosynthesis